MSSMSIEKNGKASPVSSPMFHLSHMFRTESGHMDTDNRLAEETHYYYVFQKHSAYTQQDINCVHLL